MKKFFSWVFVIISLVLFVVFIIFLGVYVNGKVSGFSDEKSSEHYILFFGFSLIFSAVFGFFGHLLAKEKSFPYYATFPMYWIIFGLFFIFGLIKWLFCKILGLPVSSSWSGKSSDELSDKNGKSIPVYYVTDDYCYRRKLVLYESNCKDYEAPFEDGHNFFWGKYYNRFKDDIGNYWRTYDGNKTFLSEDALKRQGWRIS